MFDLKLYIVSLLSRPLFQPWLWFMYKISLAGMNYGTSGEVGTSGEIQTLQLVRGSIPNNRELVLFNVGANVGEYVSNIVSVFPKNSRVFAFEPALASFNKLKSNTASHQNVTVVNMGLGERKGTFDLFSDAPRSGLASLYKRELSHIKVSLSKKEKVRVTTLDAYCSKEKIKHIHFLKVDVEGNELNVLKGASALLSKGAIDIIEFEFGGCNLDSRTYFKDFFLLLNNDFHIYRVLQHGYARIGHYHEMLEVFLNSNFVAIWKNSKIRIK